MLMFPTVGRRLVPDLRIGAPLLGTVVALHLLATSPTGAVDLFATHEVTAQFATPDGKPMANAEVRAFAPGEPNNPAVTGHTDGEGNNNPKWLVPAVYAKDLRHNRSRRFA